MLFTTPAAAPSGGVIPLFAGVLRSEARKLHTVRSTWWAMLAAVGCNVVTAALLGVFLPGRLSAHEAATADSVRISLGGLHLSQVAGEQRNIASGRRSGGCGEQHSGHLPASASACAW